MILWERGWLVLREVETPDARECNGEEGASVCEHVSAQLCVQCVGMCICVCVCIVVCV